VSLIWVGLSCRVDSQLSSVADECSAVSQQEAAITKCRLSRQPICESLRTYGVKEKLTKRLTKRDVSPVLNPLKTEFLLNNI
jgi:hypothetical protein